MEMIIDKVKDCMKVVLRNNGVPIYGITPMTRGRAHAAKTI